MKKLHLDDLRVDSFVTTPEVTSSGGTVHAHADGGGDPGDGTTVDFTGASCFTNCTCEFTCLDTCRFTCPNTCHFGCA
jgi:hypothetical protein